MFKKFLIKYFIKKTLEKVNRKISFSGKYYLQNQFRYVSRTHCSTLEALYNLINFPNQEYTTCKKQMLRHFS